MDAAPTDWLAAGGAFTMIFIQTIVCAAVGAFAAFRVGAATNAEADGCLLAITNIILAIVGAGIGYFVAPYPMFVFTAMLGSAALPSIATAILAKRMRKGR